MRLQQEGDVLSIHSHGLVLNKSHPAFHQLFTHEIRFTQVIPEGAGECGRRDIQGRYAAEDRTDGSTCDA